MKQKINSFKVKSARRFITDLSLILGLTSVLGGFVPKNNDVKKYSNEIRIESESLYSSNNISFDEEKLENIDVIVENEEVGEVNLEKVESKHHDVQLFSAIDEIDNFELPNILFYEGESIVDALASNGYDSSFEYRSELADFLGIKNYRGTAKQNLTLIKLIKDKNKEELTSIVRAQRKATKAKENKVVKSIKASNNLVKTYEKGSIQKIPVNLSKKQKSELLKKATKKWQAYDDNLEFRKNPKTKKLEFRGHNYPKKWRTTNLGNIAKDCKICKHRKYKHKHKDNYSKWKYLDDKLEYRKCSCDKTETRDHILPVEWQYNKEFNMDYRACLGCGFEFKKIHECKFNPWEYLDENCEHRFCSVCNKEEKRYHQFGEKFEINGEEYRECINCKHRIKVIANSNGGGYTSGGGSNSKPTPVHTHTITSWSRLDDSREFGLCSTCGQTVIRPCLFTFDHFEYEPNNDYETHKRLTYQKCLLDGNVNVISEAAVNCTVSSAGFTYTPGNNYEEGICADCGQEIHKDHDLELINTTYEQDTTDPEHPTHKIIKDYKCANDAYTDQDISESIDCTPDANGFHFVGGTIDEATCSVCGGKIKRTHEHSLSDTPTSVSQGTTEGKHKEVYNCRECHKNVTIDVDCTYDNNIVYTPTTGTKHNKVSTCIVCEKEKTEELDCNFNVPLPITSNATIGKHNENTKCADCSNIKTVEKDCTNLSNVRYEIVDEIEHRKIKDCLDCHDEAYVLQTNHLHNDFRNKNDVGADVYCECGHSDKHTHVFTGPTYEVNGELYKMCDECGYEVKQDIPVVHEHTEYIDEYIPGNGSIEGFCYKVVYKCSDSNCDDPTYERVETYEHDFSDDPEDLIKDGRKKFMPCKNIIDGVQCTVRKQYKATSSLSMASASNVVNGSAIVAPSEEINEYDNLINEEINMYYDELSYSEDIYNDVKIKTLAKRNPYSII